MLMGQPLKPPPSRNACSSGVVARPSMALRCGKRPKRRMMSRCSLGVFQVLVAGRAVERDAALLVGQVLRVHERQEEKAALLLRHVLVVAALERAIGGCARAADRPRRCAHRRGTCCAGTGRARSRARARPRRSLPSRRACRPPRPRRSRGTSRGSRRRTRRPA